MTTCEKCGKAVKSTPRTRFAEFQIDVASLAPLLAAMDSYGVRCDGCKRTLCGGCYDVGYYGVDKCPFCAATQHVLDKIHPNLLMMRAPNLLPGFADQVLMSVPDDDLLTKMLFRRSLMQDVAVASSRSAPVFVVRLVAAITKCDTNAAPFSPSPYVNLIAFADRCVAIPLADAVGYVHDTSKAWAARDESDQHPDWHAWITAYGRFYGKLSSGATHAELDELSKTVEKYPRPFRHEITKFAKERAGKWWQFWR